VENTFPTEGPIKDNMTGIPKMQQTPKRQSATITITTIKIGESFRLVGATTSASILIFLHNKCLQEIACLHGKVFRIKLLLLKPSQEPLLPPGVPAWL
jgi:hypothetical protein